MTNLRTGQIIWDHYRIEREVGRGGMARVYCVSDIHHQIIYAAKVVREDKMDIPFLMPQFQHECYIHPQLRHQHILSCQRVFLNESPPGMLLQYVDGYSMGARMRHHWQNEQRFSSREIMAFIEQMVEALTYLHTMGYCHCDLKPDNILVDSNGHYFLTDFGITHRIGDRPDTKLGTPKYMSPEQHQQQPLDVRTDVYAFAIIVYELLTNGEVPFSNLVEGHRTNVANVVMKWEHAHIYDNALPPSVYNRHIRPEIDRILLKALSKDANQRQPTIETFYQELRNALEGREDHSTIQRIDYQSLVSDMLPGGQLVCTYAPTTQHLLNSRIPLQRQLQFGRRRNSTIALQGGDVSRRHALVTWDGQRQNYVIYDQGSAMGTRVNGSLLTTNQPRMLQTGDLITIGEYNFRFELT